MFRAVVPRLAAQARQATGKIKTTPGHQLRSLQPSRAFSSRWLPIRRNPWVEDFMVGPYGGGHRMMERHMRRMERLMEEVMTPSWGSYVERTMPEWRNFYELAESKVAVFKEEGHFKVKVDVSEFKPEDVSVRTSGDYLVVKAIDNTKDGDKAVAKRKFTVLIPEEVEQETFESLLSEDGVLTIQAKMKEPPAPEEKVITIKHQQKSAKKD